MSARTLVALAVAFAILGGGAAVARAQTPPAAAADSTASDSLDAWLGAMADSTDRYFGISAAPIDTAGFDSLLRVGLARPPGDPRSRRISTSYSPWLGFNRVDGPQYGAGASIGSAHLGRLGGKLAYVAGPNDWLGGGDYTKRWGRRGADASWRLSVRGGRFTRTLDPDRSESFLAVTRALLAGNDRQHYLRRDGYGFGIDRQSSLLRVGVAWRDELESPLATTATWNLLDREPAVEFNQPATFGRAREIGLEVTARLPGVAGWVELESRFADDAWGSDFTYARHRAAIAAEFPLGRVASLIPQAGYGLLNGGAIPQASFFLGGPTSLRSVPSSSGGGTRKALARLEALSAPDLIERLTSSPALGAFQLQFGAFAATGAAWGPDPFGGVSTPEDAWPQKNAWTSEAGLSLLYRPGLPDPDGYIRVDYAWPLGPGDYEPRLTVSYTRAIDQLRATGR